MRVTGLGMAVLAVAIGCDGGVELSGDGGDVAGDEATAEGDVGGEETSGGEDGTTDVVPDVDPSCPTEWPGPSTACTVDGVRCEYGSETCCGETHPSYVCQCGGGSFGCYYTDACMGAPFGCTCGVDEDCEDGWGRAWCEEGTCVACDNSGVDCLLDCEFGFVPPRNGCQPCECAPAPCETVGTGYCTCDVACGGDLMLCEAGLGRCVEDICALIDCPAPCDPLRGCVPAECTVDADCKLIYSSCDCQAVPVTDPRASLDPCLYDGGDVCAYNSCEGDGVQAACRDGLCTEVYGPGCGG